MRARFVAVCAAAVLAVPALAQAQPTRVRLEAEIAPGERAALTIGKVPRGQFAFGLRASSDGEKRLVVTQQHNGGRRFTVISLPGKAPCQGAAGSISCTGITTPATPGERTWTFRVSNRSDRPMSIALTVGWKRVTSAG